MKTIYFLRDVESKGADFFMWSDAPNAQELMQIELTETLNHYFAASEADFEIGSAQVSDDYQGEQL